MGARAVRDMNPRARSPDMEPIGPEDASLYVVGDWPTEREDRENEPWCHDAGAPVRKLARRGARYTHAVRTLPKGDDPPNDHEVLAFQRELLEDVEATKPRVILAAGNYAFRAFQPDLAASMKSNMHIHRGRRFPIRVGAHRCWLVPTFGMRQYAKLRQSGDDTCRDGDDWKRFLDEDIATAVQLSRERGPEPDVWPHDAGKILAMANTRLLYEPEEIIAGLREFAGMAGPGNDLCAFDFETRGLRAMAAGAKILSCAMSTSDRCIAFPVDHRRITWRPTEREAFIAAWRSVFEAYECIAHGLEFEDEWMSLPFGREGIRLAKLWHCSLAQAYVLSSRVGGNRSNSGDQSERAVAGLGLDYLARLHLGIPFKKLFPAKLWDEVDALPELLRYNAGDAIATYEVFLAQEEQIHAEGLADVYRAQVEKVPAAVLSQLDGVPVDQTVVKASRERYQAQIDEALAKLADLEECQEFERKFRVPFNPASTDHVLQLFNDVLGHDIKSTTEAVLESLYNVEYSAKYIVEWRKAQKLESTYVFPFLAGHPKSCLKPDGMVHCRFLTTRTETGRVSAEDTNMTNLPERSAGKIIKEGFAAPDGWEWTAVDYGQIEARVLGMAARDRRFCAMLRENYDVHGEWADRLDRAFPGLMDRFGGTRKSLRGHIKNKQVFPWFFGAGLKSVARNLRVDEEALRPHFEHFWETFAESKQWQRDLLKQYKRTGYVQTLTGFRRWGPMSYNAIINMPIQGTAAAIVFWAWVTISKLSEELGLPWLNPRLMVHDDLKWLHPKGEGDRLLELVLPIMLHPDFDFINVPLIAEVTRGPNLANMEVIGEWDSTQVNPDGSRT